MLIVGIVIGVLIVLGWVFRAQIAADWEKFLANIDHTKPPPPPPPPPTIKVP